MHRERTISGRKGERGVVLLLVAIVLLFVVGAMAVLAIDLVTFYTARSEAQLAADGAALAAARVLANSGTTSDPTDVILNVRANAEILATTVATQVAVQNKVGGRAGEVNVSFQGSGLGAGSNPRVTVQVTRNDLPTFFARIWGRTQVSVAATATAEAYNPSGFAASVSGGAPVAPICVKPWVLPNKNPNDSSDIFNATTGTIEPAALSLIGKDAPVSFVALCTNNCDPLPTPTKWQYYSGDPSSFPAPTQALPNCKVGLNPYQKSVAGCVQTPIACSRSSSWEEPTIPWRPPLVRT
ncbi:MAG: hypothetical protein HY233_03815 [Acidobacteriales bacterium]|nr:hypothetical protein [Terriglobales bacterium]